jgi:hypothetical protein
MPKIFRHPPEHGQMRLTICEAGQESNVRFTEVTCSRLAYYIQNPLVEAVYQGCMDKRFYRIMKKSNQKIFIQ